MDTLIQGRDFSGEMKWQDYLALTEECAKKGRTTGPEQSQERITATKLNASRMKRIYNTLQIYPGLAAEISGLKCNWNWYILAETWCGDGAQCIPVIAKASELNPRISLRILLRDDVPGIMDRFLTDGKRMIPKLICVDPASDEVIGTWGPRPAGVRDKALAVRNRNPGISHDDFLKELHLFYFKDGGKSMQSELLVSIKEWKKVMVC